MFGDKINYIQDLSKTELLLYEVEGAIYTREKNRIYRVELEKFERLLDNFLKNSRIASESIIDNKKILLKKYENIIRNLLDDIEKWCVTIFENFQTIETEQNIVYIQKNTLLYIEEMLRNTKNIEEKENIRFVVKSLNVSVEDISDKIELANKKLEEYNNIIQLCEKSFIYCKEFQDKLFKNFFEKYFDKSEVNEKLSKNEIIKYFENKLSTIKNENILKIKSNIENCKNEFFKNIKELQNTNFQE